MKGGDRWHVLSCAILVVGMIYLVNDEYAFWMYYMIATGLSRIVVYILDKEK